MTDAGHPCYGPDLALVHDRGFAAHAAFCAPGFLRLLAPVRTRGGHVLELGCGTGLLTKEPIAVGHRVIATDASPAMLAIARKRLGRAAEEIGRLTLPDDELPQADAIVAVGHPLNYLPDADSVDRALIAMADALAPDGVIAFDVCDLELGRVRRDAASFGRAGPDWPSSPSSRPRALTASCATSRHFCPMRTGRGDAPASTTRTSSWTAPASRLCCARVASAPACTRRSGWSPFPSGCA